MVLVGFTIVSLFLTKNKIELALGGRMEFVMKKDLIFAPILLLLGVALFLFRFTGIFVHIAISVVGVIALVVYTVLTNKEWKIPALEIIMRACYGIALISGIVIMNVQGAIALSVIHKVSAVLFVALIIVLLVTKLAFKKKA